MRLSAPLRLGFLASGAGSSARAMVNAIGAGALDAEARLLVSNRRESEALGWARDAAVPALHIPTLPDADAADARLAEALADHGVELVILSGYLRRLGPAMLKAYEGRILNIHPGPLPAFGGEGMYGSAVHRAVMAAGLRETAIVVHGVVAIYDHGPEFARRAVAIETGDTAETLEARVKALEPAFFVKVLRELVSGIKLL